MPAASSAAGGGPVLEQEMGDALAVHDPGAAALDAHPGAAERLSHLGERAGPVFQRDRQILHGVPPVGDCRRLRRVSRPVRTARRS